MTLPLCLLAYTGDSDPLDDTKGAISGKVTDETGETIIGASVTIKSSGKGTITDIDGGFALDAAPSDILLISFVGYVKQEIPVGNRTYFDIILKEDIEALEEVVVVGYGTVKKSDLTGSVGQIKGETLTKMPVTDVNTAMQGRIPGINITLGSGAAGAAANVNIRGIASATGTSAPLYVVDGVPLEQGAANIQDMGISNIESIEILKDASAGAIYGARAANGVILITTKRGLDGKTQFEAKAYYGAQQVINKLDMMSSMEYRDLLLDLAQGDTAAMPASLRDPNNVVHNTDWQDEVFRVAPMQNYTLSALGGNKNSKFSLNLGYLKQEDIFITGYFERSSISGNFDLTKGRLKIGESLKLGYSRKRNTGGNLWGPLSTPGYFPVRDPSNELGGWGIPPAGDGIDVNNPVGLKLSTNNASARLRLISNTYAQVDLIKGMNFRINFGTDIWSFFSERSSAPFEVGFKDQAFTSAREDRRTSGMYNIDYILNYSREFGKHSVTALLGYNVMDQVKRRTTLSASNLPTGFDVWWAGETVTPNKTGSRKTEYALLSRFGRFIYSFDSRYIVTYNIRQDFSSNFSRQFSNGVFPSVSTAWNVHEEKFAYNWSWLTQLKVRAGFGELGFDQIPEYRYSGLVSLNSNYVFDNAETTGYAQTEFGTPDIRWESSITRNIGIDVGLFDNKLTLSGDLFGRRRENMLVAKPIPSSSGSTDAPFVNAGTLEVKGFEFSASYQNETSWGLRYDIGGNISSASNKVISLGGGEPIVDGETVLGSTATTLTEEGSEIGAFFGYVADGIWQESDTSGYLNNYNTYQGYNPGDVRYKDINGDGTINSDDRVVIGSPNPDFTYGLNIDLGYKNFDLSAFFQGVQGVDVYNIFGIVYSGMIWNYNQVTDNLNRYTPENPSETIPSNTGNRRNVLPSTRWIEDGSYLRLKNIQIGYSVPAKIIESLGISRARIYVSGQNVFTWTKFRGYDPEVGSSKNPSDEGAQLTRNVYTGAYPQPKVFLAGVQINF